MRTSQLTLRLLSMLVLLAAEAAVLARLLGPRFLACWVGLGPQALRPLFRFGYPSIAHFVVDGALLIQSDLGRGRWVGGLGTINRRGQDKRKENNPFQNYSSDGPKTKQTLIS